MLVKLRVHCAEAQQRTPDTQLTCGGNRAHKQQTDETETAKRFVVDTGSQCL